MPTLHTPRAIRPVAAALRRHLGSSQLRQLTNVLKGALAPAPSAKGGLFRSNTTPSPLLTCSSQKNHCRPERSEGPHPPRLVSQQKGYCHPDRSGPLHFPARDLCAPSHAAEGPWHHISRRSTRRNPHATPPPNTPSLLHLSTPSIHPFPNPNTPIEAHP